MTHEEMLATIAEVRKYRGHDPDVARLLGVIAAVTEDFKRDLRMLATEIELLQAQSARTGEGLDTLATEIELLQAQSARTGEGLDTLRTMAFRAQDSYVERMIAEGCPVCKDTGVIPGDGLYEPDSGCGACYSASPLAAVVRDLRRTLGPPPKKV